MKKDLSDAEFDKILAKQWDNLNRRERRLAKFNRQALKDAMTEPRYRLQQNVAPTFVTTEIRK
jgi:hypothetical protein